MRALSGSVSREVPADFTTFVSARYSALVHTARALVANPADAEDLVQEALTKCVAAWPRIHGDPEAYVRTAMVRTNISRWRRRRVAEVSMADVPEVPILAEDSIETSVLEALAQLAPRQRTAVVLRHVEGCTERETAELMGCSVGAVKSSTSAGLARLREVVAQTHPVS